jgi:hypothetical protein
VSAPASTPVLLMTLQLAVPLWIERWKRLSWAERTERLEKRAAECAEIVASKGDVLQYGGKGCAEAFNALAEGLAILSFVPGGVKFHGLHWETKL